MNPLVPALTRAVVGLGLGALLLAVAAPRAAALEPAPVAIRLTTQPPASQIHPFPVTAPTHLLIDVADATGAPVKDAVLHVTLKAPPAGRLFSTGFPIFEGTTSFSFETPAPEGRADIVAYLPVRGAYAVTVKAAPPEAAAAQMRYHTETFTLDVPENAAQVRNAALLLGGLFLVGLAAGWFFARTRLLLLAAESQAQPVGK